MTETSSICVLEPGHIWPVSRVTAAGVEPVSVPFSCGQIILAHLQGPKAEELEVENQNIHRFS